MDASEGFANSCSTVYNSNGSRTETCGSQVTYYDGHGKNYTIGEINNSTTYEYTYINGEKYISSISTTYSNGSTKSWTYDYDGDANLSARSYTATPEKWNSSYTTYYATYEYDTTGKQHTTSETTGYNDGSSTKKNYNYDNNGDTYISSQTTTKKDGSSETYSYDSNGTKYLSSTTTTDADGKTKTCNNNSNGQSTGCVEQYADKYGNQYTNTYDSEGKLLSSTSDILKIYTLPEAHAATTDNSTNNFLIRYR
jgi:hypothetical protein